MYPRPFLAHDSAIWQLYFVAHFLLKLNDIGQLGLCAHTMVYKYFQILRNIVHVVVECLLNPIMRCSIILLNSSQLVSQPLVLAFFVLNNTCLPIQNKRQAKISQDQFLCLCVYHEISEMQITK